MLRTLNEDDKTTSYNSVQGLRNSNQNFESNITNNNKHCCVCLNSFLDLNCLTESNGEDVSLFTKLQLNIPQVVSIKYVFWFWHNRLLQDWQNDFYICVPCTNLLNIVHNFRETCISSDVKRQNSRIIKFDDIAENTAKFEDNDEFVDDKTDCLENGSDENVNSKENQLEEGINII